MNLERSFKYPLKDSGWWLKGFIAFLLFCTGIGAPCTAGYILRASRSAARDQPLPEWEDFGGLFMDGLRVLAMQLGYLFPGLLVMLIGICGGGVMTMSGSDTAAGGGLLIMIASFGGGYILLTIGGLIASVAYVFLMHEKSSLGDAFAFGKIFQLISANIGTVLLFLIFLAIVNGVVYFAIQIIASLTFGLGYFLCFAVYPYTMFVTADLQAQLAKILLPYEFD